ncbi:hypothetical protein GALMADRAFT_81901, partial [Galerina marginata CBS 339.88]
LTGTNRDVMVNPGAFRGSRKEFLMGEKADYAAGVDGGYAADALGLIQRRFFKRYPIALSPAHEPTPEFLAAVNDNEPDPEEAAPNIDDMSPIRYASALKEIEINREMIIFVKAQIKRWMAYQYMKDHDMDPKESGSHNPFRVLLHNFAGTNVQRPRLRTPANVWRKTQREQIDAEMFAKLEKSEQADWRAVAKDEHDVAMAAWEVDNNGVCSTVPADRQRCIQGLVKFAQPILDLICEATGWKATLIAGGPEPANDGRLNIVSIHSGTTTGDVKMNFGRAARVGYKKNLVPLYGQFLQMCYTPEECRARALPVSEGFEPLLETDIDQDGGNLDSWIPTPPVAASTRVTPLPSRAATPLSRGPTPPLSHCGTPPPSPVPLASPSPSLPQSSANSSQLKRKERENEGSDNEPNDEPDDEPDDEPTSRTSKTAKTAKASSTRQGRMKRRATAPRVSKSSVSAPTRPISSATSPAAASSSSTTTAVLSALTAASDAPKWFKNTLSMLQTDSASFGPRWKQLVALWAGFEEKAEYSGSGRLKSANRPSAVSNWIQRARSSKWRPEIKNVVVGGDWEVLRSPGVNGLVSVLAALFYWGLGVSAAQDGDEKWAAYVADCLTACRCLLRAA